MPNDPRAAHRVCDVFTGYCVKFIYKGYEISLAGDGTDARVYRLKSAPAAELFVSSDGTGIEQIVECKEFIDNLEKEYVS